MQGVRWGINLRARSSALYMQGVRWGCNLRARSSALSVQGLSRQQIKFKWSTPRTNLVQALTPFPRNIQSSSSLSSPPFAAAAVGTALLGADRTDGACENRSSSLSSE